MGSELTRRAEKSRRDDGESEMGGRRVETIETEKGEGSPRGKGRID